MLTGTAGAEVVNNSRCFAELAECAATWAVSVVRLVMDQRAWKLCRQRSALGLLLFLGWSRSGLQGLKLCFNRRDIGIDQAMEQAGLLRCLGRQVHIPLSPRL